MNLPKDIVFQILLSLPVLSLLRFSSVCKDWYALIKSSIFKDTYLALQRAKPVDDQVVGLKLNRYDSGIYKSFATRWYDDYEPLARSALAPPSSSDVEISGNRSGRMTVIGHFNGIVCIKGENRGDYWEDDIKENWFDMTLVNPALREFIKLPVPDVGGDFECDMFSVGFGYDDATNDYKVFAIVTVVELGYEQIGFLYHLSTNSWRKLGPISEFVTHNYFDPRNGEFILSIHDASVFSHGSIHWIMSSEPNYRILTFNLTSESFQEMLLPSGWSYDEQTTAPHLLTIDKSTIALAAYSMMFDIWVMKEYGDSESWTKQYSLSLLHRIHSP